ncbi:MAG TPA: SRPBCC family protein [Bdellovibrionota bacterium]|nr:SRPBCC family protein [Bdellovibrionota bacterium]
MKRNQALGWLAGSGVGAAFMYYLDPNQGRRRRAMARDRMSHLARVAPKQAARSARDLSHRTKGVLASAKSAAIKRKPVSDDILEERIRSQLGRAVSHPTSVEVLVHDGEVTLKGLVLAHEARELLRRVKHVQGVRHLHDELELHQAAEHIPALQGGKKRGGARLDVLQKNWAPATRFIMGTLGTALGVFGFSRKSPVGYAVGTSGLLALLRAAKNVETRRILGLGQRRAILYRKSFDINVPPPVAFAFWADFTNFPSFLSEVKEVRRTDDGNWHWTIAGPLGTAVSWNAKVTRMVPDQLIAWRALPGELIRHAGRVRFTQNRQGGTRIQLDFTYHLPVGMLGNRVARIFGSDPKKRIDESLTEMKRILEGNGTAQRAAV